ncbi:hypothetical protein JJE66_14990 [Bradyrhizobium diazoefficiens]|uniref:hypothetical protein n=1 Tax=Bradyrhizobium diazoefficiens TaxID=1355477 RepID=UPI001909C000|nr:hypothetical protein [Bradyrhizobium diazoefficiens]MBK3662548.1 hypothetical protein [Bradyrhizobium diazoefficiens]
MPESSGVLNLSLRVSNGTLPFLLNAVIEGDLNAEGVSALTDLPPALTIEGRLLLRGTRIRALPSHLRVGGVVELEGCTSLQRLAEDIVVGGDLDLELCSNLTELPERLVVRGDLYLFGTSVRRIPRAAEIGGSVYDLTT